MFQNKSLFNLVKNLVKWVEAIGRSVTTQVQSEGERIRFSFVRFHARPVWLRSFCGCSLFARSFSRSFVFFALFALARWSESSALESSSEQTQVRSKLPSDQTQVRSKLPLIRLKCARNVLWSDSSALETASDQTQVRSKRPLIRLKCARNDLWSDSSALETASDQTQVRSKRPLIRLKCARNDLWSDSSALETASDQTQVRSIRPLIRLKCARNVLWSDRTQTMVQTKETMIRPSRPNWPLIRPNPDHGPD